MRLKRRLLVGLGGLSTQDVVDATPFYKPMLLGGVLAAETDQMFVNRKR